MAANNGRDARRAADKALQRDAAADPWDRQPGEGDERWEAFCIYRDQLANGEPRRSLRKTAASLSKSATIVQRWSAEDGWPSRAAAYDREQDAIKRSMAAHELERVAKRQANHLGAAAQALIQPIQAYLRRLTELGDQAFTDMSLAELRREARESARLMPQLVQAERLVHGLSTNNLGGHDGGAIEVRHEEARRRAAGMSREELERTLLGDELAGREN